MHDGASLSCVGDDLVADMASLMSRSKLKQKVSAPRPTPAHLLEKPVEFSCDEGLIARARALALAADALQDATMEGIAKIASLTAARDGDKAVKARGLAAPRKKRGIRRERRDDREGGEGNAQREEEVAREEKDAVEREKENIQEAEVSPHEDMSMGAERMAQAETGVFIDPEAEAEAEVEAVAHEGSASHVEMESAELARPAAPVGTSGARMPLAPVQREISAISAAVAPLNEAGGVHPSLHGSSSVTLYQGNVKEAQDRAKKRIRRRREREKAAAEEEASVVDAASQLDKQQRDQEVWRKRALERIVALRKSQAQETKCEDRAPKPVEEHEAARVAAVSQEAAMAAEARVSKAKERKAASLREECHRNRREQRERERRKELLASEEALWRAKEVRRQTLDRLRAHKSLLEETSLQEELRRSKALEAYQERKGRGMLSRGPAEVLSPLALDRKQRCGQKPRKSAFGWTQPDHTKMAQAVEHAPFASVHCISAVSPNGNGSGSGSGSGNDNASGFRRNMLDALDPGLRKEAFRDVDIGEGLGLHRQMTAPDLSELGGPAPSTALSPLRKSASAVQMVGPGSEVRVGRKASRGTKPRRLPWKRALVPLVPLAPASGSQM